ncbi:putative fimbrial chaperone protein [Yersinia aldovae]|uniref:fimbrial biogenesis chaperone n=1 Tax=Yersinia aldovae TaxID=29483 RepID=UPI0005E87D4C|nr:molecular chaperone [Yersinia aldovae]CNG96612.1 putative fimbrial chaperone protein [Yersinia aldovae]
MLFIRTLILSLLLLNSAVQAGVVIGGTRVIYPEANKSVSLNLKNSDNNPYLVQSWVESEFGETANQPFIITPPLFRFEGQRENLLRIIRTDGSLPTDRESMFWLNIKSIAAVSKSSAEDAEAQNALQVAIKNRIKLIYRPTQLIDMPEAVTDKLKWQLQGNQLTVTNPTPYYMNFQQVKVGGVEVEKANWVGPKSSITFTVPKATNGREVSWYIITDFGGAGSEHKASL